MPPGAGDGAVGIVATATGGHQPPFAEQVRQRHHPAVAGGHGLDAHVEVGEGIVVVHVGAGLEHDQIGLEDGERAGYHQVEHLEQAVVAGVGLERHVDAGAGRLTMPALVGVAGAWKQIVSRLVQTDGQYPRFVVEQRLDAIAVMDVEVEVGDAQAVDPNCPLDGDGEIVVEAETRSPIGHGVVQAAREVHGPGGRPGGYGVDRGDGGAHHPEDRLVHVGEDGVVSRAEAEVVGAFADLAPRGGLDNLDVVGPVDVQQLRFVERLRFQLVGRIEQPGIL